MIGTYEMNAQTDSQNGSTHSEFFPDLDLVELHRLHAALANAHIHHDLRGMPEVERLTAMADVLEQIEELLAFERMPWKAALEQASRKINAKFTRSPHRSTI
jgi:hypothetical protein